MNKLSGIMAAFSIEKAKRKMARGVIASFLGMLVMACSGCGGGGGSPAATSSTAQATPASSAPVAASGVLIEAYGDSTTQGWESINGTGFVTPANVPALLQSKLQAQFGSTVIVSNQGVGGTEASQLLNGTDGVHAPWPQVMAASTAKIVTLNFALNDPYYARVPKSGVIAESPTDYANYMTQLVQIAKAAGKTVILMEPNPGCEPIRQPVLAEYVDQLRQVASTQSVQIVAHYDPILAMPNWQSFLTDCLHPGDALYDIKANQELPVIAQIVKTMP